jgi:hypothetical protein
MFKALRRVLCTRYRTFINDESSSSTIQINNKEKKESNRPTWRKKSRQIITHSSGQKETLSDDDKDKDDEDKDDYEPSVPAPTPTYLDDDIVALQTGPDVGPSYSGGMAYDIATNSLFVRNGATYGAFSRPGIQPRETSSCFFGIIDLPKLQ